MSIFISQIIIKPTDSSHGVSRVAERLNQGGGNDNDTCTVLVIVSF